MWKIDPFDPPFSTLNTSLTVVIQDDRCLTLKELEVLGVGGDRHWDSPLWRHRVPPDPDWVGPGGDEDLDVDDDYEEVGEEDEEGGEADVESSGGQCGLPVPAHWGGEAGLGSEAGQEGQEEGDRPGQHTDGDQAAPAHNTVVVEGRDDGQKLVQSYQERGQQDSEGAHVGHQAPARAVGGGHLPHHHRHQAQGGQQTGGHRQKYLILMEVNTRLKGHTMKKICFFFDIFIKYPLSILDWPGWGSTQVWKISNR